MAQQELLLLLIAIVSAAASPSAALLHVNDVTASANANGSGGTDSSSCRLATAEASFGQAPAVNASTALRCQWELQLPFLSSPHLPHQDPLFLSTTPSSPPIDAVTSTVHTGRRETEPSPAAWLHCTHCAIAGGRVQVFKPVSGDGVAAGEGVFTAARNRWHTGMLGRAAKEPPWRDGWLQAEVVANESYSESSGCDRVVEEPVVVFSMICLHPGFLMLDVLEPLFAMVSVCGVCSGVVISCSLCVLGC